MDFDDKKMQVKNNQLISWLTENPIITKTRKGEKKIVREIRDIVCGFFEIKIFTSAISASLINAGEYYAV